jgi:hypothetical protein
MNFCQFSQMLLRDALFEPELADGVAECDAWIAF